MIRMFGLKNCDTCRNARKWLDGEGIQHAFVDVRADGIAVTDVERWAKAVGWETLLNRRGTTWRGLGENDKADVDAAKAVRLMGAHPALIKRPVFEIGTDVLVGFGTPEKARLKRG